jgi:hypothetical protein
MACSTVSKAEKLGGRWTCVFTIGLPDPKLESPLRRSLSSMVPFDDAAWRAPYFKRDHRLRACLGSQAMFRIFSVSYRWFL